MTTSLSLIAELETAISDGSRDKRHEILSRVTDLFLENSVAYSDEQVNLFDDVLLHLSNRIQTEALAALSTRLAPVPNAPTRMIQGLARHDDIAVSAPVLALSERLTDDDLVEIASTKSQQHLAAMSVRARLAERVTDVLVTRGDREVVHRVAGNAGAALSKYGFSTLVARSEGDDILAERMGRRVDLPPQMLHTLLAKASETVRARLAAAMPGLEDSEIEKSILSVAGAVGKEMAVPRDFAAAERTVDALQRAGGLDATAVGRFAEAREYEKVVVGLARLSSAPVDLIDQVMRTVRCDGLLVACKAAKLGWPTVRIVLANRLDGHAMSPDEVQEAKSGFLRLTQTTAQRVLRFWIIKGTVAVPADRPQTEEKSETFAVLAALKLPPSALDRMPSQVLGEFWARCHQCKGKTDCRHGITAGAVQKVMEFCPNAQWFGHLKGAEDGPGPQAA